MFSNECCRRVQQANFFNPNPDTFMTTKKVWWALSALLHLNLCAVKLSVLL